jgi:hypothetical protein
MEDGTKEGAGEETNGKKRKVHQFHSTSGCAVR